MLYDCHVHVSMYPEPEAVCRAASEHGITLVGVSVSPEDSARNLEAGERYGYPAMAGIHPWYAKSPEFPEELFLRLISTYKTAGFGECGLDASDSPLSLEDQMRLLECELEFAKTHHLCVNLHVRGAHGALLRLLRQKKLRGLVGCLHNFTFSKELAREYMSCGLYLSVGHHILKKHPKMAEALRYAGICHILLESDYDHLHTGPYDTALIVREMTALSEILEVPYDQVHSQLAQNSENLLKGIFL